MSAALPLRRAARRPSCGVRRCRVNLDLADLEERELLVVYEEQLLAYGRLLPVGELLPLGDAAEADLAIFVLSTQRCQGREEDLAELVALCGAWRRPNDRRRPEE